MTGHQGREHHRTPDAHRCHAPFTGGRITGVVDSSIVPAMDAYLYHHRVCPLCAAQQGLTHDIGCTTDEWYAPNPDDLCTDGRALLEAWQRAITVSVHKREPKVEED